MTDHEHEWDDNPSPRFQLCKQCGQVRHRVDSLNKGEVGRTYWDLSWKTLGARYNTYPNTYHEILLRIKPSDRVLDVACGTGPFLRVLHEKFPGNTKFGVDISKVAIDKCETDIPNFVGVDCEFPETFPEEWLGQFDAVVCTEFLEHSVDDHAVAGKLAACLARGGKCFISVPDNMLPHETEAEHERTYTLESFKKLLEQYFNTVRVLQINQEKKLLAICE